MTVMPCYDKKLEASRDDFVFGDDLTEVDSVLTTGEILELIKVNQVVKPCFHCSKCESGSELFVVCVLQLKGVDFKDLEESPLDRL